MSEVIERLAVCKCDEMLDLARMIRTRARCVTCGLWIVPLEINPDEPPFEIVFGVADDNVPIETVAANLCRLADILSRPCLVIWKEREVKAKPGDAPEYVATRFKRIANQPCRHSHLDMDGICRSCGADCRGIHR
jgi:hypothetical protein